MPWVFFLFFTIYIVQTYIYIHIHRRTARAALEAQKTRGSRQNLDKRKVNSDSRRAREQGSMFLSFKY